MCTRRRYREDTLVLETEWPTPDPTPGEYGPPVADHAQGAHLRTDGRDRGRPDDLTAEQLGGARNWDYRYCWLRDASFTLEALLANGYDDEAVAWRDWLPPTDPRVTGTVAAVERALSASGYVLRYRDEQGVDGMQGAEGAFLACTFWLADAKHVIGATDEAVAIVDRLVA